MCVGPKEGRHSRRLVFAVRTGEGNFAKLKVIGYRDSHDFSFEDAKYIPPDLKTFVLSRPKIADRHLESVGCCSRSEPRVLRFVFWTG